MRKIFSAALALVCALFATSSYAATTCVNLFDPTTAVLGDINTNGVIGELSYRIVSDFIPVVPGQKYVGSGQMYMANSGLRDFGPFITGYYNANKEFISGSRTVQYGHVITIPDGVSYARVEYGAPTNEGTAIIAQSKLQFEQGDTATTYCSTCDGEIKNSLNLFNSTQYDQYKQADGTYRALAYTFANIQINATSDMIGKTYTFSAFFDLTKEDAPTYMSVLSYIGGVAKEGTKVVKGQTGYSNITFTPTSTNDYFGITYGSNGDRYVTVSEIQLEQGSERTTYHPYGSYCQQNIRVATTKYVESEFAPMVSALQSAISVVDSVVSRTITQAASIATLQSGKQTRPDETCPAGKKCLLVEGTDGQPHWYEICSSAHCLPDGYTELGYIESTGTQWIDTGNVSTGSDRFVSLWNSINASGNKTFYGASNGSIATGERSLFWMDTSGVGVDLVWPTGVDTGIYQHIAGAWGASGDYLFDDNLTSFTYNGTSVSRSVSRNFTSRYHLFLFAVSRNGVDPIAVSNVRLKYFKWYRNDELIHEYIPAKRNSNNTIGLYDTVDGQFYTNAGTGSFIAGPVVE